ncbi:MAG: MarR family transcriptional regulator, partial [Calditrichaeota bacterium]
MDEIQHGIIEDFGLGYVKFGHSELMGRVVGLLLCSTQPVSIDDICRELDVTKTPINQICRRLEDLNLIRRIRMSGERKYFYQISTDVFLQASINYSRLIEDNLQVAENHLEPLLKQYKAATGEEKQRLHVIC